MKKSNRRTRRKTEAVAKGGIVRNRARGNVPAGAASLPHEKAGLKLEHYEFCLNYLANGFNATAAYKATYPGGTDGSARVQGHQLLTNVNVKSFLAAKLQDQWKARQISGEEALGRVALDATSDLRQLSDAQGNILPVHEWPDDLANSIEALEQRPDGTIKVKLVSKLGARRIILEQTGKLASAAGGLDALAAALREDLERRK